MRIHVISLALALAVAGGCSKSDDKKAGDKAPARQALPVNNVDLGTLKLDVPKTWKPEPPRSRMRKAQFSIPGKAAPVQLVVYYFGKRGAGNVQANLDRWVGQLKQPDGKPSKQAAKVDEKTINGLKVTTVDVSGRYTAAMRPGAAAKHNSPNSRMLAAIVIAPDGPYYFKLVGPAETVTAAKAGFDQMIASVKPAK